jgi:hypothetical protein
VGAILPSPVRQQSAVRTNGKAVQHFIVKRVTNYIIELCHVVMPLSPPSTVFTLSNIQWIKKYSYIMFFPCYSFYWSARKFILGIININNNFIIIYSPKIVNITQLAVNRKIS